MNYDLVVVGAGPAGLTAGIYGGRAGLETLVLERGMTGGAASTAPVIQNYPGFASITGAVLVGHIRAQALKYAELHELEEV